MNEFIHSESIESNQKIEDFNLELQKYWKKIISNLGDDFQSLVNLSRDSDCLGILQSLNLIEDMRQQQSTLKYNDDIRQFLQSLKDELHQQNQLYITETNEITQILQQQQSIEQENQEMLIKLSQKQEENKKKIIEIENELSKENIYQIQHNHNQSLPLSFVNQIKSQLPKTTYNSPINREIRQQSMYNSLLAKAKLTQVPIKHNDYQMKPRKNCKQNVLF